MNKQTPMEIIANHVTTVVVVATVLAVGILWTGGTINDQTALVALTVAVTGTAGEKALNAWAGRRLPPADSEPENRT